MKIKTLGWKTAVASGVYYVAIFGLLALVTAIVVKLMFWPPCSIVGRNECVVDGWSVSGLAATILGVAAAILTLLGAFAVAAWWTDLNRKVDERVDEQVKVQMKERVDQLLKEQERTLLEKTDIQIQQQRETFEDIFSRMHKEIKTSQADMHLLQSAQKITLKFALLQEPWLVEELASEIIVTGDPTDSQMAILIFLRYIKTMDGFFSTDPRAVENHKTHLANTAAPDPSSPVYYWEKVLFWQQVVITQKNATYIDTADYHIKKFRPFIEKWKAEHTTTGEENVH